MSLITSILKNLEERDYRKEYDNYQGKPEQKQRRAQRNAARSIMVGKGKAKPGDGKDVDHKDRDTGNNDDSNLRMQDPCDNRSRNSTDGE